MPERHQPIIEFYSGRGTDTDGRFLRDLRRWDFNRLEIVHDYIQWLFPLRVRSQFNPDAPLLDEDTIRRFLGDDGSEAGVAGVVSSRCSRFTGSSLHEENGQPAVETGPDWETRQRQWLFFGDNHNLLRITRILTCLGTLGLRDHARAFLAALEKACADDPGVVGEPAH